MTICRKCKKSVAKITIKYFGKRRVEMCHSCWDTQGDKQVISFGFNVGSGGKG